MKEEIVRVILSILELMAGTITDWEASSRYKESFIATVKQLNTAKGLYDEWSMVRSINYLMGAVD